MVLKRAKKKEKKKLTFSPKTYFFVQNQGKTLLKRNFFKRDQGNCLPTAFPDKAQPSQTFQTKFSTSKFNCSAQRRAVGGASNSRKTPKNLKVRQDQKTVYQQPFQTNQSYPRVDPDFSNKVFHKETQL